jgi:hypothetical protein
VLSHCRSVLGQRSYQLLGVVCLFALIFFPYT